MKKTIQIIVVLLVIIGCSAKENYVAEERVFGLYERQYYNVKEFICLSNDFSYEYYTSDSTLNTGSWEYRKLNNKSMIGLNDLSYSMALEKHTTYSRVSVPVKYSKAKKAVLLRMNPDDHFQDFVRVDSIFCEHKLVQPTSHQSHSLEDSDALKYRI